MEPPDVIFLEGLLMIYFIAINMIIKPEKISLKCMRLRGKGPNDSDNKEASHVPYLSDSKFVYDGIPSVDNVIQIIQVLNMGLGTIMQNGWSLLDTAKKIDAGGELHVPNRAALRITNPKVVEESLSRDRRLFCVIMNYTKRDSYVYSLFMKIMNYEGTNVYAYIIANSAISMPPKLKYEREHYFKNMTMENQSIHLSAQAIWKWLHRVMAYASKINVDARRIKEKFIDGLPDRIFKSEKTAMRQDNRFVIPGTYGGMFGYPAYMAAIAHPHAGQPDVTKLAHAFYPIWIEAVNGMDSRMIKGAYAHELIAMECDDGPLTIEEANMLSSADCSWTSTDCVVCGGKGHAARCKTESGEILECPTLVLKTKPTELIREQQNKNTGDKYKKPYKAQAKMLKEMETKFSAMQTRLESFESAHAAEDPREEISDDSDSSAESSASESDTSEGSMIDNFAEQVQGSTKKRFSPRKPAFKRK